MATVETIKLDVDAHKLRVALKRLGSESEKEIRDVVKKATIDLRSQIRTNAPVQSGLLASTIRSRTSFTNKKSEGRVLIIGPARRYAWIVEHGSKSHNAFEGRKYVERSEKAVRPDYARDLAEAVDRAVEQVGLGN